MPKVFMNETVGVQTVGAGGIGMIPPVPVETVEKIDGNVREMHEVTAPAGRIPNPVGKEDGETINIQDEGYVTSGFSVPDPKNASDNMVLAVEDGEYKIVDPSVQTDVADLVADPYSTESTYAVGDPTVYENELYICNTAITQGEAWTAAHWTKKPLGEAMVDGLGTKVNKTQTVNGKALSGDITLTAEDIGYDDTVDPHSANSLGAAVSDLKSVLTLNSGSVNSASKIANEVLGASVFSFEDSTEESEKTVPEKAENIAIIKKLIGKSVASNNQIVNVNAEKVRSLKADGTTVIDEITLPVMEYFPNGMMSVQGIQDELTPDKVTKRVGIVDLGTLSWSKYSNYTYAYYRGNLSTAKDVSASDLANVMCPIYDRITVYEMRTAADVSGISIQDGAVCIRDDNYSTAAALKTALSGVYAVYELKNYSETLLDVPFKNTLQTTPLGKVVFTDASNNVIGDFPNIVEYMQNEDLAIAEVFRPLPSTRMMNGIDSFTIGYKFNNAGAIVVDNDCVVSNDYFFAEEGTVLLMLYTLHIVRYTMDKAFVSYTHVRDTALYSGQEGWNVFVAPATGYYRFTFAKVTYGYGITRLDSNPFEIVCLGDSIFGNNQPPYDLPTYIEVMTGKKTANCGFGGTEAGTWDGTQYPNMQYMEKYNPLSYCGIADAIASGDWTDIDIDWYTLYGDAAFMPNKYILKNIDFSKVRVITVAFGENDWAHKRVMDNEEDLLDTSTFKGALRYGTETILTAYPNINIVFLSPIWSYAYGSEVDYTMNTDNTANGDGVYLSAYITAMKEVAAEYHLPFFDNYTNGIINALNGRQMIRDKSHLNTGMGVDRMGRLIGAEVASVFDHIPNYKNGNLS